MFEHTTVLKKEAVQGLRVSPSGIYVDCTLGGGGHSKEILQQLSPDGHLYAFDQDDSAIKEAQILLEEFSGQFTLIKSNFRELVPQLKDNGVTSVDGILFDLGVSSPQLDKKERGFSYHENAPLDMRMDQGSDVSAYDVVNHWSYESLVSIMFRYGEEKFSKQIARKIEANRERQAIETTGELVEIIKEAIPAPARRTGGHPAKRTFQAIRIAVNDELHAFEDALGGAFEMLNSGGRIAVITFHSLEDRITKTMFKKMSSGPELPPGMPAVPEEYKPEFKLITRKPILPDDSETAGNRRSRSAKLRIVEKL